MIANPDGRRYLDPVGRGLDSWTLEIALPENEYCTDYMHIASGRCHRTCMYHIVRRRIDICLYEHIHLFTSHGLTMINVPVWRVAGSGEKPHWHCC